MGSGSKSRANETSFLKRHRETFFLVGFTVYVALLLIGTIGNLFEINAITSFWLYR